MFVFKIFEFGEELHGATFHILLNKILKKEYSEQWMEAKCELDNIHWIEETPINKPIREKVMYQRYNKYFEDGNIDGVEIQMDIIEKNRLYKWDFCSESRWSKIGVIIPELFFLDSKKEMTDFFNKSRFASHPITEILEHNNDVNDQYNKTSVLFGKRVYVKPSGFSVYGAGNFNFGNNSGNMINIYHNFTLDNLKMEYDKLESGKNIILQSSVENMMFYNNRKFDIRFHVLFLLYNEELYVFSHEYNYFRLTVNEYNDSSEELANFITNYNYQKKNDNFKAEKCQLMTYLLPKYDVIHENIKNVVIELSKILVNEIKFNKCGDDNKRKPQLWFTGFDFIIDNDLKPWLIEINHNPGFLTPYPKDKYEQINLNGIYSLIGYFLTPILEGKPISKENQGVFNFLYCSKVYFNDVF